MNYEGFDLITTLYFLLINNNNPHGHARMAKHVIQICNIHGDEYDIILKPYLTKRRDLKINVM